MKKHSPILSIAVALLAAAGCAGTLAGGGAARPSGGGGDGYQAPASTAYASGARGGGGYEAPATATVAPPPSVPDQRPGLGTVWGERVSSQVVTRPFVRDTDNAFAVVAIHYNDADGVAAHAQYLGGAVPAPIYAYTPYGGISVALADTSGAVLSGVVASGRTLVVGSEGQRYNLLVTNNTPGRFEVVASVDGLDVLDGKDADLGKRGYIVDPYSTLVIDGFRASEQEVAAFRFGRVDGSYAARTGSDRNVGVVGFAFFAEEGSRWTTDELGRRDAASPFPGDRAYAAPPR